MHYAITLSNSRKTKWLGKWKVLNIQRALQEVTTNISRERKGKINVSDLGVSLSTNRGMPIAISTFPTYLCSKLNTQIYENIYHYYLMCLGKQYFRSGT